jgi:hypothetical protein
MQAASPQRSAPEASPARLYALVAGGVLSLLGVAGFFFDAGFGTGAQMTSDDVFGILEVNGWRNVVYMVAGLAALALTSTAPRLVALVLGIAFTIFGIWGLAETERGVGTLLQALPLSDGDNVLHLVVGVLGLVSWATTEASGRPGLERLRRGYSRPRNRNQGGSQDEKQDPPRRPVRAGGRARGTAGNGERRD